jgi:hypothetical protein
MSEVTTGAVALSLIGAPLAVGVACLGGCYFAAKFCVKQYEKMLVEIEKTDKRLKWLEKDMVTSPKRMAEEARILHNSVLQNSTFTHMCKGLTESQKSAMAGVIATQNSPLKAYVPSLLDKLSETSSFQKTLEEGTKNLALDNFTFVNTVVRQAAAAVGFAGEMKILRQKGSLMDVIFTDHKNPHKKLAAYCKLDRQLNPSLALDLEGFDSSTDECSQKMEALVKYLHEHGVPFTYKRLRHNQPMGILRKMIQRNAKREVNKANQSITDYLQGKPVNGTVQKKQINK